MQKICLLGASGSVGDSTLKVIRQFREHFSLHSFSVHSNIQKAAFIIEEFSPQELVVTSPINQSILGDFYKGTKIFYGANYLQDIVSSPKIDTVVTAIVGSSGIYPTIAAIRAGKKIAIANKETLVTFGPVIQALLSKSNSRLVPVDSEHNALFQLLEPLHRKNVKKVILTASGGPFRDLPIEKFPEITKEQALKHPTWNMGPKITVDSAGMVNKGLEVIEAYYLFGFDYNSIDVVIHPESIVHGIVELVDGASLLYASHPDMIFPVAHSLFHPLPTPELLKERKPATWKSLNFREPDNARYPALQLAYKAGKCGGTATAIFNAANEEAVSLLLQDKIRFIDIPNLIEQSLEKIPSVKSTELEVYLEADRKAREIVRS